MIFPQVMRLAPVLIPMDIDGPSPEVRTLPSASSSQCLKSLGSGGRSHHFLGVNPLFLWPFSIAMLNYRRVKSTEKLGHGDHGDLRWWWNDGEMMVKTEIYNLWKNFQCDWTPKTGRISSDVKQEIGFGTRLALKWINGLNQRTWNWSIKMDRLWGPHEPKGLHRHCQSETFS